MTLEKIKAFILLHGHLPNMPSSQKVERDGIAVGELNKRLLEKIEELTLHTLEQQQQIDFMLEVISEQNILLNSIKNKINE